MRRFTNPNKKLTESSPTVKKYLEYKAEFEYICDKYGLEKKCDDETFSWLLEIADDYMNAFFCSYFQAKYFATEEIKTSLGKDVKFTQSDLKKLIDFNQNSKNCDADKMKKIYKDLDGKLYNINLLKHSIDAKYAKKHENYTNPIVVPSLNELQYSEKTKTTSAATAVLQNMVKEKEDFDLNTPEFNKILHSLIYVSDGQLSEPEARKLVCTWKHLPYGGFGRTKNALMKTCEDIALAYKYFARKNIVLDDDSSCNPLKLDGLNVWLEKHGLKLVELDGYEKAEDNYKKFVEAHGFNKSWKERWGLTKK